MVWRSPPAGMVKVNTDGFRNEASGSCTCGGVIRDEQGRFVQRFMFRIGSGSVITAEAWGILWGIKLAWEGGFRNVIVESDCTEVLELIQGAISDEHPDATKILEIQSMLERSSCLSNSMQHPLLNMQKFEQNQRPRETEPLKQYSHHRILFASPIIIEVGFESMKLPQISPVVNLTHSSHIFKKSMCSHWKFLVLHQFDSLQQEIYVQPGNSWYCINLIPFRKSSQG